MTISQQIKADLQEHASRGRNPPYRLTLTAIADHFGVSIQPVRTAVEELLNGKWLVRDAQRQLLLNPGMKGRAVPKASKPSPESPQVEQRLMQMIIEHSLQGRAVFLREEESAEQFGVGRSVVRSILNRLSGKGVVEHVPRRGWRICTFSEKRMQEYLDVREVLELRAMELARGRLDRRVLENLLRLNSPTKAGRVRIDNALHGYWIEQAHNRYISEFFGLHGQYYATLFDYASLETSMIEEMAAQHRAILEALLGDRIKEAQRVLRRHIRSQCPNVGRLMEGLAETIQAKG